MTMQKVTLPRVLFIDTGHDDDDLLDHSGQQAQVLRQLEWVKEVDPEVGPMYRIRFDDGKEIDAFADEITCLHDDETDDASECIVANPEPEP